MKFNTGDVVASLLFKYKYSIFYIEKADANGVFVEGQFCLYSDIHDSYALYTDVFDV